MTSLLEADRPVARERTRTAADLIAVETEFGAKNYKPLDVVLARGQGVWVWEVEGRRYLD